MSKADKVCTAEGCEGAAVRRGLCQAHYLRAWRGKRAAEKDCKAEGCDRKVGESGRSGMCSRCYSRVRHARDQTRGKAIGNAAVKVRRFAAEIGPILASEREEDRCRWGGLDRRQGWRRSDEIADRLIPDWRLLGPSAFSGMVVNIERALDLLVAEGALESAEFNGWRWWRAVDAA